MLALNQIDHCANSECMAIYRTPTVYEPLMSFCPCCRQTIMDEAEKEKQFWIEVNDEFENDLDGPTQ